MILRPPPPPQPRPAHHILQLYNSRLIQSAVGVICCTTEHDAAKKFLSHCFHPPLPRLKRDSHIIRSRRSQQMLTLPSLLPHGEVRMTTGEVCTALASVPGESKAGKAERLLDKKEKKNKNKKPSVFTWSAIASWTYNVLVG